MIKQLTSILILCLFGMAAIGQLPELQLREIKAAGELTSQNVTCMAQDSVGYIWIGTINGLNKYDGYEFYNYTWTPGDSTTIAGNNITEIHTGPDGKVRIITNIGLSEYLPSTNSFKNIDNHFVINGQKIIVTRICEDNHKDLFVSSGRNVYRYDPVNESITPFAEIDSGEITAFSFDSLNNLWIGNRPQGRLYQFDSLGSFVKKHVITYGSADNNSLFPVRDLVCRGTNIFIAYFGGGLVEYSSDPDTFHNYLNNDPYTRYVNYVYVDREKRIWVCDITGIKVLDESNNQFVGYYPDKEDPYSIKDHVTGIIQDRQDNYWTYHFDGGVMISTARRGFKSFDAIPVSSRFWKTSSDHISAISEDKSGNLWLGNPFVGIDVFRWQQHKISSYKFDENNPYSLGKGSVFSIYRDRFDTMWIGTNMGGLQYFDDKSEKFYSYRHNPKDSFSIANDDVRSVTEDNDGNLWLIVHGKGVDRFDRNTRKFYHYTNKNSNLSNDWAYQVMYSSSGDLWVATVWGVSVLHKNSRKFQNYFFDTGDSTSISSNEIECIFEDHQGIIWIGTMQGLNRFNAASGTFTRYFKGFSNSHICSVEEDLHGNLWISTFGGLVRFTPETGKIFNFSQFDGLPSDQFVARSSYNNSQNALFFGNIKGVVRFNPDELKYNETPPKVVITGYRLFNLSDYKQSYTNLFIPAGNEIILKHNQNVITLQYIALNMINPDKNQYAYMLEGFDRHWNYVGQKREATYTNLDPGKYTFKVINSNNNGVWSKTGDSLRIVILPAWWATWYFRVILFVAVILLIAGLIKFWLKTLIRQKERLENIIYENTIELENSNTELFLNAEELNHANEQLVLEQKRVKEQSKELMKKNKELEELNTTNENIFSIIAHDLRSPFNALLGYADLLVENHNKFTIITHCIFKS